MTRRGLALLGVLLIATAATPGATAAQPTKTRHIVFLGDGSAATRGPIALEPFREGLRELGYVEGRHVVVEARWTEGSSERIAALVADAVARKPDVIVTHGVPLGRAVKAATTSIPIVIAVAADMVGTGLVASLSRPGGNLTGTSDETSELGAKEVEILKAALPGIKRVGVLWNGRNPGAVRTSEAIRTAARGQGLHVIPLELQAATDIEEALDGAVRNRAGAVIVAHDVLVIDQRARITAAALARKLPAISAGTNFADAGGLLSYGPDLTLLFKRAALFVDKILRGARPADLPIEQPVRYELVVNRRTAKLLGLAIPPTLILRADRG